MAAGVQEWRDILISGLSGSNPATQERRGMMLSASELPAVVPIKAQTENVGAATSTPPPTYTAGLIKHSCCSALTVLPVSLTTPAMLAAHYS